MNDATRLGMALMEPPTVRPSMSLRGEVRGTTAREIAEKARDEAFAFFQDVAFELDISVEQLISDETGKTYSYVGTWWARSA